MAKKKVEKKVVKVNVTKKYITQGEPSDGSHCPIALALRAKGYDDVMVDSETAEVFKGDKYYIANLPAVAKKFVEKFDNVVYDEEMELVQVEEVKPIKFELKFIELT
jgi:hypothetical protein